MLQAQAFDFSQARLLFSSYWAAPCSERSGTTSSPRRANIFVTPISNWPEFLRYFIQTPELHSIHHQLDVHDYNYSDLLIWDRIFGTYKGTTEFMPECGFLGDNEECLVEMIAFKDVYEISRS